MDDKLRQMAKERVKKYYLKHMSVKDIVRILTHAENESSIEITENEVYSIIVDLRVEWEKEIFGEGRMRVVEELMSLDELEVNAWRDKKYNNVWKIKVLRVRLFEMAFDIQKEGKNQKQDAKTKQALAKRYNIQVEIPGFEKEGENEEE